MKHRQMKRQNQNKTKGLDSSNSYIHEVGIFKEAKTIP